MRFKLLLPLAALLLFFPTRTDARPWTPEDECPETISAAISSDSCEEYGGDYCTDKPTWDSMNSLHTVLCNCPNITSLDLRVTGLGCSQWPSRWNFPFHPAGGETYPRLTSLRLEGYRFDRGERWREDTWRFPQYEWGALAWMKDIWGWVKSGDYKIWLQWKRLPMEQQQKSNFALWLDAMDWSGIEELRIDGVTDEMTTKLPSHLPSLHTLESTNLTFIQQFPNNTLKNLTWVGYSETHDLPILLSHQGQPLQSLEFRCPELWRPFLPRQFDISILGNTTNNLTHLSINVPRNGTWPLESFQTIASLPSLRKADLYLNVLHPCWAELPELGSPAYFDAVHDFDPNTCTDVGKFQMPYLDGASALQLVQYMKAKNVGRKLEEVTFWVGDWTRPWDGPLYMPIWLEGKRAKVVCNIGSSETVEPSCVMEEGEKYWKGPPCIDPIDDMDSYGIW